MIRSRSRAAAALALLATLGACSSGGGPGEPTPARGSGDALTAAEMEAWAAQDLYTVIQRLRPRWLQSRQAMTTSGVQPMSIVINGARQQGSTEILRGISAGEVEEVQFMSARDATTVYGTDNMSGALVITLRRGAIRT